MVAKGKKELIFNFFGYETNDPIHILGLMGVSGMVSLNSWGTGWEGCLELGEMFL